MTAHLDGHFPDTVVPDKLPIGEVDLHLDLPSLLYEQIFSIGCLHAIH